MVLVILFVRHRQHIAPWRVDILRASQLDAARLDNEVLLMLQEQFMQIFSKFEQVGRLTRHQPEAPTLAEKYVVPSWTFVSYMHAVCKGSCCLMRCMQCCYSYASKSGVSSAKPAICECCYQGPMIELEIVLHAEICCSLAARAHSSP